MFMGSWTFAGKETEKLTLNSEYNTDQPYASCYPYDYPVLVTNREAGSAHRRLIQEYDRIARSNKTYIRSTIKTEEVQTDRYPKV
jgi:hypothetical protein